MTNPKIDREMALLEELEAVLKKRLETANDAHGAVMALTMLTVRIANLLCLDDKAGARDMLVKALNMALKMLIK